jgi:uncharacterized protein YndB with AHSA1/START domain
MTYPTVSITRDFDASRERVFEAWLDQKQVCAWMSPGVSTAADIDPRTGGRYGSTTPETDRTSAALKRRSPALIRRDE